MHKKSISPWVGNGAIGLLMLAMIFTLRASGVEAVDCLGKPYGFPGCPTKTATKSSVSPKCGDSNVQPELGEECDDGRFNGQTTCGSDCRELYCGDSKLSPFLGEECEPKTEEVYVTDPETGELTTERRFTETGQCGSYCRPPSCDDFGNCEDGCRWEFQAECTSSSSVAAVTAASSAASVSSRSSIAGPQSPLTQSGATSSRAPQGVPLATTSSVPAAVDPVSASCGDGRKDAGEECDDANRLNDDACTNECRLPRCGDSITQFGEQCDDGNDVPTDSCTNQCTRALCGDGITQFGEQCDDANNINTDGCTRECRAPRCGDGYTQITEECDDGNQIDTDACSIECKLARCGDSITQEGEDCDDGNQVNNDSCTNKCTRARCGDGVKQKGEQCDDGNDNDADGCSNTCRFPVCGNGVREGKEDCDDGNKNNDDSCTNACKYPRCGDGAVQPGEECDAAAANSDTKSGACRSTCKKAACGDGVVDTALGELCDGDATCTPECTLKGRAPMSTSSSGSGSAASVTGGVDGTLVGAAVASGVVLLGVAGFLLRKKILAKLAGGAAKSGSIEDLPLDQIEMPWHKW